MAGKVNSARRPRPRATRRPPRGPARHGRPAASARRVPPTSTRSAPMRAGRLHVARAVADHGRVRQPEAQLARRLLEHAGARLAAVARVALVRAVVHGVDAPAGGRDCRAHARMDVREVGLGVAAEGDAALVRRHDDRHVQLRQHADPVQRARQEREFLPRGDVLALGGLAVDDAVAVEEDRAQVTSRSASSHRMWAISDVRLLDAGRLGRRGLDAHVGGAPQRAAVRAGEADRRQAAPAGRLEAGEHVRRAAARGDPDRDVARGAERLHLAREDAVVAVVVGDRRDGGGVVGERQGRERAPLGEESPHELGGDVRRVGRAASVAEGEHLPATAQAVGDERGRAR